MNKANGANKLTTFLSCLLAALLVLVPFHAFLTVWLASNFGHYELFRLWIEAVIVILLVGASYVAWRQKVSLVSEQARWLWWLSVAYILLHVLLGAVALAQHAVNLTALSDGFILNLRLIVIFWLAVFITIQNPWLRTHWQQLLLWPAMIVVAFGLLQHFVLPIDFLRHFGYGPKTILPYETVDQKLAYVRIMSTLRGANPFGAYLVLVIATLAATARYTKKPRSRWIIGLNAVAVIIALIFTYSRSAWIGSALAIVFVVWLSFRQQKSRQLFAVTIMTIGLVGVLGLLALRHNNRFENTFFHTDKTSRSATSSNQNHVKYLEDGLRDIAHNPLGRGPGTAGPASVHNNHPARIAEDYYVQLGQEVGLLGAAMFILINVIIGKALWRRKDPLALALFASLLGITIVNFFSHAWTDDTLGVLWWALAGIALAGDIMKAKRHGTQKTKEKSALSARPAR